MLQFDFKKYCLILVSLVLVSINILAQNGWTKKADIPKSGGTASVVDGKIYVFGGSTPVTLTDVAFSEMYDPATNTWVEKTQMPTARGFLTSAVVDNKIYVIGGGYPTSTNKNEVYDPATNTWTTKKEILNYRLGMKAAVVEGIIYIFGGNYNERNCQAYDPSTNIWTEKTPIPAGAGGGVSVTAYNGLIYVFGGSTYTPWGPLSKVYAYNPQTDTYTQKKDMPTPRFAFQTFLVGEKIFAIGGCQYENSVIATVEVYDPLTDNWKTLNNKSSSIGFFSGAVVNNKIYVISGTRDWSNVVNEVWEYDPALDPSLPVELTSFTGNIVGGKVLLEWSTSTETNNKGFEIYRNGKKISFIDGNGTTTEKQDYSFYDTGLNAGLYNYRLNQIDFDGTQKVVGEVTVNLVIPEQFSLEQNYPNPFNPSTNFEFRIADFGLVTLKIYDVLGNEVATLVNEEKTAGTYEVTWNAESLSSGVYYYQLKAGDFTATKKLLLLK